MARIVNIRVPKDVSERDVIRWVAEGLSRRVAKKLVIRYLEGGIDLDLERALREFEETRNEVWKELEEEYRRKGLL
ncbi:MAG: hypothetical protein J7J78_04955 [Thermoprotei archaeon]|nr:hypothetical protein [Thermoprotei archaeon]